MAYKPGIIILNKYRIEKLIAEGSFGEVYRVTHLGLKVERAIKVLKRGTTGIGSTEFSDCQQRFEMEAQLGAELNTPSAHPNLLQVHNFQQEEDLLVLEMEYAPGGSLADRIARARKTRQPIPIEQVIRIGVDVASGLAELHELDIVHRDLKPSNILFDSKERAKVADLGLAQIPGGPSMRTKLSEPPPHPGTPGYMSPEQKKSRDYLTSASDVYTLGLVLFETLTGRIYANQPAGIRARSLRPDVPRWLDNLIAEMLNKSPDERPWDGGKVVKLLDFGDKGKKCFGIIPVYFCIGIVLLIALLAGIVFLGRQLSVPVLTLIRTSSAEIKPSSSLTVSITPSPIGNNTVSPSPTDVTLISESTSTNTPVETDTPFPTPTITLAYTASFTPTSTYTPTPSTRAIVVSQNAFVYSGPGTNYEHIASFPNGYEFDLIGRNLFQSWATVLLDNDEPGWVYIGDIKVFGNWDELPLYSAPPSPTPAVCQGTITNNSEDYELEFSIYQIGSYIIKPKNSISFTAKQGNYSFSFAFYEQTRGNDYYYDEYKYFKYYISRDFEWIVNCCHGGISGLP